MWMPLTELGEGVCGGNLIFAHGRFFFKCCVIGEVGYHNTIPCSCIFYLLVKLRFSISVGYIGKVTVYDIMMSTFL